MKAQNGAPRLDRLSQILDSKVNRRSPIIAVVPAQQRDAPSSDATRAGPEHLGSVRSRLHPDPVESLAGNPHLHIWACDVLLNSLEGPIAEPDVKLFVDKDQPQTRPVFALFCPDSHYL